jgi:hypothetical protein
MRITLPIAILIGLLAYFPAVSAEMSSANFKIRWDSVGVGGSNDSSSASYQVRDSLGNNSVGRSLSTSYTLASGFREGVFDQIITFDVLSQNNGSQVAATGLAGTTVTCATAGFSVGDLVALVQDLGASQVSAVGRIVSIGAGNITVDELKDGGSAPVIDGTNDHVYRLSSSSISLGTLSATAVSTVIVGFDVSSEIDSGYVVQVYSDGNLRSGANDINNVADGTVTVGAEEYGGRSSDTALSGSTFDSQDTAFSTAYQDVADEPSVAFASRNFLTLKASMSGSTPNATYGQILSFIVSGNY